MPYTGRTNALGQAHGQGVVHVFGTTLTGVFVNGAPMIGNIKYSFGARFMATFDEEGTIHGDSPYLSELGDRCVYPYTHGKHEGTSKGQVSLDIILMT